MAKGPVNPPYKGFGKSAGYPKWQGGGKVNKSWGTPKGPSGGSGGDGGGGDGGDKNCRLFVLAALSSAVALGNAVMESLL